MTGGWHHVTAVFYCFSTENAHDFEKYIDGVEQSLSYFSPPNVGLGNPTPNNVNFSYQELLIGTIYPNDGYQFNGKMDELSLWNGILTDAKIQELVNCPPDLNEANLVGYWNFNSGNGNTLLDQTSNGYNGIISGATWSTDIPSQSCLNCTATDDVVVTVNPQDDATFAYSLSSYCSDDTDPSPTISGTAGGVFSSTTGLSINAATGQIDLDASTAGTLMLPIKLFKPDHFIK